ncbi:hypothetical protein Tco_1313573 [Tanacetum coccineum]
MITSFFLTYRKGLPRVQHQLGTFPLKVSLGYTLKISRLLTRPSTLLMVSIVSICHTSTVTEKKWHLLLHFVAFSISPAGVLPLVLVLLLVLSVPRVASCIILGLDATTLPWIMSDQTGSNSGKLHVSLAGPNPEHMDDEFLAPAYPKTGSNFGKLHVSLAGPNPEHMDDELTKAEEEAVAREVHATHARIVSGPDLEPMQEDQTGSNSGKLHVSLAGPNPEHMADEFLATAYPKVHENLKLITDERVIEENPESHYGSMSSMKNLDDTYNFGGQFIYDKPTEDDKEKSKVIEESDSTYLIQPRCLRIFRSEVFKHIWTFINRLVKPLSVFSLLIEVPSEMTCPDEIKQYFLMTDYALWEVILNGNSPLSTRTVDGVKTVVPPTTVEQNLARKNELKQEALC